MAIRDLSTSNLFEDSAPAVSDQQIFDWFLANKGADDATIASTMDQFNLSPADIARATGADVSNVQSRYDAITPAVSGLSAVISNADTTTGGTVVDTTTGGTSVDTITGGTGVDTTITGGLPTTTTVDTVTGATGNDTVISGLPTTTSTTDTISGATTADTTTADTTTADTTGGLPATTTTTTFDPSTAIDLKNGTYLTSTGAILNAEGTTVKDTGSAATATLASQILGQNLTDKWKGEGFGSAESNAADMASILAGVNITDLSQFGLVDQIGDLAVIPQIETTILGYDQDGNQIVDQKIIGYTDQNGKPIDPSLVKTEYVGGSENDGGGTAYTTKGVVGKTYGNTTTGEAIERNFDSSQKGSNIFGGTFQGKGNTAYRVDMSTGKPVFYTTKGSSNDLANIMQDLGPLGQVAIAVATGGLSIPQQIAANMAIQVLSGQDIGDAIKNAAISYVGAQIPGLDALKEGTNFIKDLGLSAGVTDILTNSFQNAAVSSGKALLSGKDIGDAMLTGAVSGGTSGAVNVLLGNIEGFSDLTNAQKKMVTNAVTGVVSGQPLDQIVINTAIATANAEMAKAKGVSEVVTPKVGDGTATATTSGLDSLVNKEIESALTVDASGSKDVNSAAKFAQDQGYNKFTFDGKTYTIGGNEDAKVSNLEATVKAETEANKLATTATNLAGGEFAGVDAQVAATAKANNTVIGNAEADTPEEAAFLAKQRNPTGNQFTFGGLTYTMGGSGDAVDRAITQTRVAELNDNISNAPSRSEAFRLAREGLGAGQTFTWDGKSYSTNTAEEAQAIANSKIDSLNKTNLATTTNASSTVGSQNDTLARNAVNESDAETARLARQNTTIASAEKTGLFGTIANAIQGQMKLSSEAANDYLKNNPNSPITNSVSTAYEAAGNLQKNVGGGLALLTDNKPLSDSLVKSGDDLTKFGQSIGNGVVDTKNWNETTSLIQNAKGWEKLGIIAGRIMDGNSGLGRQVEIELRQELPGLFLGGSSVKGIMLATGAMDTAETAGNAALDAYDAAVKNGKNHADALSDARTAGAVAGATEAAVQLTLGKLADFGAGKIGNVAGKGTAKVTGEGIVEGTQEAGAGVAVDLALGNALDPNKYITQGVLGTAVGKGTAVATTPADVATSETINNNISTAVASGDVASVNGAITNSVQQSLNGGASVNVAVGTSVNSAISNGADANASISTAVSTAIQNGADANQVIDSSIASAISAGADVSTSVNSAVTTAISAGADANTAIATAVNTAINSGSNATTAIDASVQAAIATGVDSTTAINTAVTSATNATTNAATNATTNAATNATTNAATNATTNATTGTTTNAATNATTDGTTNVTTDGTVNTNADTNTNLNTNLNTGLNTLSNLPTTLTTVDGGLPTVLTVPTTSDLTSTVTSSPLTTVATSTPSTVTRTPTKVTPKPVPPKKVPKSNLPTTQYEFPTLETVPSFLKGAPKEKAMQLAALKQIYSSLTPEMQEVFAAQGIRPPEDDESSQDKESDKDTDKKDTDKKDKKSDKDKTYEELLAEEDAKLNFEQLAEKYSTKFAATGGEVKLPEMKDAFNPNLKTVQSMLAAAPTTEVPFKLSGLKHLKQGISKAPRAVSEYAQGGLPTKYAKAAPKGHNPEFITGLTGFYAQGKGTGQSDDIPAMLHDGDYVIDADAVAALGDGSSKAGAQALSQFQSKVPHKMSSGGQAVPAKIADGEYVFPEAFVSALGGGDNKHGAKLLDAMREELREHKRSAPTSKIPPKAKSPLDYLRMAKG